MTTAKYKLKDDKHYYRVFEVDRTGKELKDEDNGELVSPLILKEVQDGVTDVVIACHGWNTRQKENDSVGFYTKLFNELVQNEEMQALQEVRPGNKFQFIGVHWPSAPIGALFSAKGSDRTMEDLQKIQVELATTDPVAASKLQSLLDDVESSKDEDLKEAHSLEDLPESVRNDFLEILEAMEPEDDAKVGSEDDALNSRLKAESTIGDSAKSEVERTEPSAIFDGVVRTLFGGIERVFFGRFEERAATVGSVGVHDLLSKLQKVASPSTRFHIVGHSLGCHLANSALIGNPRDGNQLSKKVHTMMLLQGAVPHNCYQRGQMYRAICSKFQPVAGPIIVTTSQSDNALHAYRQFHGHPLGHKGASNTNPINAIYLDLQDGKFSYGFRKKHIYNFKADKYIDMTEGLFGIDVDGSHSDVMDREVLHCLFEAMRMNIDDDDYKLPNLPSDYFTNTHKQREKDEGGCVIS